MIEGLRIFIDTWGLTIGIGSLIVFMFFIIWDLAKQSGVGKLGSLVMFMALGLGMFGFIIKVMLQGFIEV